MTDKMTEIFLDEANDLLDKLEDLLLELENNPSDADTISAVFRSMHTIKGSSGMFGFDAISHFTHEIETVFDDVRNQKLRVTSKLITLTLKARDQIRQMLDNEDKTELSSDAEELINSFKMLVSSDSSVVPEEKEEVSEENKDQVEAIWRIRFEPSPDLFKNGTRPLGLLEELRSLGTCSITPFFSKIPPLNKMDPHTCYLSWQIIITTKATIDELKDVFIFIDSDSKVDYNCISLTDELIENNPKKLGEILVEKNETTEEAIAAALGTQKTIGQVLTDAKVISKEALEAALSEQEHVKVQQEKKQQENVTQTIKVNSEKLDKLIDLVGELVTFNARLGQLSQSIQNNVLSTLGEQGERLIIELRDTAMDMRMLPIGTIFSRFRRLVRDLSGNLNKDIELVTEGAETELDKTVIEKLNDPLVHLIRNSVDHGIEMPEERKKRGKSPVGKVLLKAQHAGAFVLITIEDDGAGINKRVVKQKAIEKRLISPEDELSDAEIYDLIFMPGFSTASQVTSVSGRGVGMDVVKKDIMALGGTVTTVTEEGKGTKFILKLPLTLAIIEGILVQIADSYFIIQLSNVFECLGFERKIFGKISGSINIRNEVVPYIDLRNFFEIDTEIPTNEQVVIVNDQDSRIGLVVDKVIGNYQTVIKPLGKLYKNVTGISGATILGDGSVALIIDVFKLSDVLREADNILPVPHYDVPHVDAG